MYNYNKLLGKIKENGFTLEALSKEIGLNISTLSKKFNNKSEFLQREIRCICKLLEIDMKDIGKYFFCQDALQNRSKKVTCDNKSA